ncbi:MAG: hypothetical protein ACJ79K_10080 [Gemmatimonadaceae bacterium]
MSPKNHPLIADDQGWLITPRALTSVATVVGLVYTLHAPVRYVLHVGETVDVLSTRVAALETEIDQQRGTIAAAESVLQRERSRLDASSPHHREGDGALGGEHSPRTAHPDQ